MKKAALFIVFCLFLGLRADAIEEINNSKVYYLKDCIKIAIENSPRVKKAKYAFDGSKAVLGISKSRYFPTLGAGAGLYQYVNSTNTYDDGYSKRNFPALQVYIEQLIFDFGKTNANINMQKFHVIAAEYEYNDSICETINSVKVAYFKALEAMAAVEVEKNNLLINQKIVENTKKLYESGIKSETDYINSKVYLIDAQIRLEDALNTYHDTIADLCNEMYVEDVGEIKIKSINEFSYSDAYFTPEFVWGKGKDGGIWRRLDPVTGQRHVNKEYKGEITPLPFTLQEAYIAAEKNNPELKVLEALLEAMRQQETAIRREWYPELKGRVGYGRDGKFIAQKDSIKNNQLNVAVTLNSAVNIKKEVHELDNVKVMVKSAANDVEMFRQNLHYEIKKDYADVITAQKQIYNVRDKVQRAIENLEAVTDDYNTGKNKNVGFLELQNANQQYNMAKLEYIGKLRAYNISLARLERATHFHGHDHSGMHAYKDMHSRCDDPSHYSSNTQKH